MPYYKPIPQQQKTKVNRAFWKSLRREYGDVAYLHALEQQGGLVHVNYYLMTDTPIDTVWVKDRWQASLEANSDQTIKRDSDAYCASITGSRETVLKYILKYNNNDPESYLPEKGRYRQLYYTSQNWDKWIKDRSEEVLLDKLLN